MFERVVFFRTRVDPLSQGLTVCNCNCNCNNRPQHAPCAQLRAHGFAIAVFQPVHRDPRTIKPADDDVYGCSKLKKSNGRVYRQQCENELDCTNRSILTDEGCLLFHWKFTFSTEEKRPVRNSLSDRLINNHVLFNEDVSRCSPAPRPRPNPFCSGPSLSLQQGLRRHCAGAVRVIVPPGRSKWYISCCPSDATHLGTACAPRICPTCRSNLKLSVNTPG